MRPQQIRQLVAAAIVSAVALVSSCGSGVVVSITEDNDAVPSLNQIRAAFESSVSTESGRISSTIEIDGPEPGRSEFFMEFNGSDYYLSSEESGSFIVNEADGATEGTPSELELLRVGDEEFLRGVLEYEMMGPDFYDPALWVPTVNEAEAADSQDCDMGPVQIEQFSRLFEAIIRALEASGVPLKNSGTDEVNGAVLRRLEATLGPDDVARFDEAIEDFDPSSGTETDDCGTQVIDAEEEEADEVADSYVFTLWVDSKDLTKSLQVVATNESDTYSIRLDLWDLGTPIEIVAPSDDEVFDLDAAMAEQFDGSVPSDG